MSSDTRADQKMGVPDQEFTRKNWMYLEWLLAISTIGIIFGHVERMGLNGAISGEIAVDNRVYKGTIDYVEGQNDGSEIASLEVRYISVARQWCFPLTFWAFGGWVARTRVNSRRCIVGLLSYAAIGIVINIFLWFLSPMNPRCDPKSQCPAAGSWLLFTIVPHSGDIFPSIYQMIYPIELAWYLVLFAPFIGMMHKGRLRWNMIILQCSIILLTYGVILGAYWDSFPFLGLLFAELIIYEVLFFVIAGLTMDHKLYPWLPPRASHYLLAVTALLQFSCTPIANGLEAYSPEFSLYIYIGASKLFLLGYMMGRSRNAEKLVSHVWPLVLVVYMLFAPSTNWYEAGNLVYPYFPRMIDRFLFAGGTFSLAFVLDRMSRFAECAPLPTTLGVAVGLAFLLHPLIMTICVACGMTTQGYPIFYIILIVSAFLTFFVRFLLPSDRREVESDDDNETSDPE